MLVAAQKMIAVHKRTFCTVRSIPEVPVVPSTAHAPRTEIVQAAKKAIAAAVNAAQVIAADATNAVTLSAAVNLPPFCFKADPVKQARTSAGTATTSSSTPSPGAATSAPRHTAESV